jgi:hypothetical protein
LLDSSQKGKRVNDMVTSASIKRHASWKDYPHVGQCYGVRNRRRGKTAYSRDGVTWFDSYGTEMDRPAGNIMFHGGFLEGKTQIG